MSVIENTDPRCATCQNGLVRDAVWLSKERKLLRRQRGQAGIAIAFGLVGLRFKQGVGKIFTR
jgi:hypothetical protein